MNLCTKIRHLRLIENISQEGFAQIMEINQSTYSRIEHENADPKLSYLTKIANYYNISISELFELDVYSIIELKNQRLSSFKSRNLDKL